MSSITPTNRCAVSVRFLVVGDSPYTASVARWFYYVIRHLSHQYDYIILLRVSLSHGDMLIASTECKLASQIMCYSVVHS